LTRYWFISTNNNRLSSKLALFTFILAFIVIILGAYTRLTDAGLSCPDWPHCYGFVTAPHTASQIQDAAQRYPAMPIDVKKAWTEMTHRYFAGTEGIFILFLSLYILSRKNGGIKSKFIGAALILLLCSQVTLGMLTVTEKLKPVIVLSHLLNGLSILSVLWWAFLESYLPSKPAAFNRNSMTSLPFWIALFVIIGQITLGGWVSTHYAGLACVDFPYCNGQIMPIMQWNNLNSDLITIHMLHRIGALVAAVYLSFFGIYLLTKTSFRVLGAHVLVLLALQVTLGILNIMWLRPVWLALIHQSVAILLLLTIITALVKVTINRESRYVSWSA